MGRLIDASNIRVKPQYMQDIMGIAMIRCEDLSRILADVPTVEAIPKAEYENRLKVDMAAMLEELKKEIEEIKPLEPTDDEDWQYGCFHGLELMQDKCLRLIQQKINSLKEA